MKYSKDLSIIVPVWRGAIRFLPTLLNSIPNDDRIEIISPGKLKYPLTIEDIKKDEGIGQKRRNM